MSTIVVKNFPDRLHALLKERAALNHRSMTKEVVHLIETGLDSSSGSSKTKRGPLPAPMTVRGARPWNAQEIEAAIAERSAEPAEPEDGRAALRSALVKQPDGSYVNVLGIDDAVFFDTLDRIRADTQASDVKELFGDVP